MRRKEKRKREERSNKMYLFPMCIVQEELLAIRGLVERGDNVQRLSRKLAGIKKKRVNE